MKRDHLNDKYTQSFGPVFKMVAGIESMNDTWIIGDIVLVDNNL